MLTETADFKMDGNAAAWARFTQSHDRTVRDMGLGSSEPVRFLAEALLPRMADAIEAERKLPIKGSPFLAKFLKVIADIDTNVLALCALQMAFTAVGQKNTHVANVSRQIGRAVDTELFGRFLDDIPGCSMRAIEKRLAKKHGAYSYRLVAAKAAAKRKGLQRPRHLTSTELTQAGGWLLSILLKTLPEVFVTYEQRRKAKNRHVIVERLLTLTDEAVERCDEIAAQCCAANPVHFPQLDEPAPWTGYYHELKTYSTSKGLVRTRHKETERAIKNAIKSGQMQPALDAINHVQSVAFMINRRVLDVQLACIEQGIAVKGIPAAQPIPSPEKAKPWEDMSENEQRGWRKKAAKIADRNRARVGQLALLSIDLQTAKYLAEHPAFWTLHSIDWRGRLYPVPHFNFQREDRARGLFLFRDGQPIGERGLWWLKVHLANCGDFNKVSKRSFEERVAWVDENIRQIGDAAMFPLDPKGRWWMDADKPFLFLAACMELCDALIVGPSFVTHLPVSWDGSCSGLQHLSAMSRANEGALVNLTASEQPQDVYQRVADVAKCAISSDDNPLAKVCLAVGVDRKLVKRNVMTFAYSATKFGMGQQHVEDTMEPLEVKVLSGELAEHPYGEDGGMGASIYLASHVLQSIKTVVQKPAEVMGFLQALARTMAHEGKPVQWTTPVGLPWSNRYHPFNVKEVKLWLHDKGVRVGYKTSVAEGYLKPIDKRRVESSVAPNFVHACDASHLMLTVNAAYAAGIRNFALVHDSFGCLASQSDDMHRIIREQFVAMYEDHDVLAEVLAQCKCDLTVHNHDRLPNAIEYGSLNIRSVLDARYAFA